MRRYQAGAAVAAMLATSFVCVPILWLVAVAVRPDSAFFQGSLAVFPRTLDMSTLWGVLGGDVRFRLALANSLLLSSAIATVGTAVGVMTALFFQENSVATAQKNLWIGLLAVRFLPVATVVPGIYWLFLRWNLLDTVAGLVVVGIAPALSFTVLILAPIVARIPESHLEMARMEGASPWAATRLVVIPKIRGIVVVLLLVNFTFAWNEYLLASFLTETSSSQPVSVLVASGVGQHRVRFNLLAAGAMISIVPAALFVASMGLWRRSSSLLTSSSRGTPNE